jgi:tetratricopeptide (TPR) repeat protein
LQSYPEAVTTFEKITELYPENEESYLALAEIYRELNDIDEAIRWLSSFREWGKNEQKVSMFLAELYEAKGDFDKALYYLKSSFEKDSSNKWIILKMCFSGGKGNDMVAIELAARGGSSFRIS